MNAQKLLLRALIAAYCLGSTALAQTVTTANAQSLHDTAIGMARDGDYPEAVRLLQSLREFDSTDRGVLRDLAVTLAWAERDAEAFAIAGELDPAEAPLYVLLPVAKSARNVQQFDVAVRWYRQAMAQAPDNPDAVAGLSLSLTDAGQYAEARAIYDGADAQMRREPRVLSAIAYNERMAGNQLGALQTLDQLLAQLPENREALRDKALVLRNLLLPEDALALIAEHPGIMSEEEIARLEVDALAIKLRMAASSAYPDERQSELLAETIDGIKDRLAQSPDGPAALALKLDLIVALHQSQRAEEAVETYESLGMSIDELPSYVLTVVGGAYLDTQQPRRALAPLQRAIEINPDALEARVALIYAYLDMNRYRRAMAVVEDTIKREPMMITNPDTGAVTPNADRVRTEVVAAIADASIDRLRGAQNRLEQLLDEAPNNTDARQELATVYRWRGWIDQSLNQYDQIISLNSSNVSAHVGRAYSMLDAQQFESVAATIRDLNRMSTPNAAIDRLNRSWELHNRSELVVEAQSGESTGATFGTEQVSLSTSWYSPPIGYHYRVFVQARDNEAVFPYAEGERQSIGVGFEYRNEGLSARLMVAESSDPYNVFAADPSLDNGTVYGAIAWRISDRWRLDAEAALNGLDSQLRGYRRGVQADQASVSTTFMANEAFSIGIGTGFSDYTDGNRGQNVYSRMRYKMLAGPRSLLYLTGELYRSENDLQDVWYFSPVSDQSSMLGLEHRLRLRRNYSRELQQLIAVQFGEYDQYGYEAGDIWRARYSLTYGLSESLSLELGAMRMRNVYDGLPEYDTIFLLSLAARL